MSIITQDALRMISDNLSPTSRLNLAAIDQRFYDVATRWSDVKTIVFDDEEVTLAGPNFVHTYQNSVFDTKDPNRNTTLYKTTSKQTALNLCPAAKKLIIQTKLTEFDGLTLDKMNLKNTKLYMSVENLSLSTVPRFEKLRTLHLVINSTKEIKVIDLVEPRLLKPLFPNSLTRVCLTGIFLTESLLNHLSTLPNLLFLDLIGCLVDTRVGVKYVPIFEKFAVLDELSLPPSLFSFSTKAKTQMETSFKKLKVSKLSLFMDQFDEEQFSIQMNHLLPKNLMILVLFGNYLPLKSWNQLKTIKKFIILFGPNIAQASCPQANLTNVKLLSHFVRCPPYVGPEHNVNFLRNHEMSIAPMNWQFSLVEWKGNGTNKEIIGLRRRMRIPDGDEIDLEGIRIPPPVIQDRMRQMRENQNGSPNDFQFIDPLGGILAPRTPQPQLTLRRDLVPIVPAHHRTPRTFGEMRRSASRQRRNRSAPPPTQRPNSDDSMRTQPPSPPETRTGAVLNNTLPSITPIGTTGTVTTGNGTVSRIGGTSVVSELNRAFVGTPAVLPTTSERRQSTSSVVNSEMTMSTATASPERINTRSQVTNAQSSQSSTTTPGNNREAPN